MVGDIGAIVYTPYHFTMNGVDQLDGSFYLNHGHIFLKITNDCCLST